MYGLLKFEINGVLIASRRGMPLSAEEPLTDTEIVIVSFGFGNSMSIFVGFRSGTRKS